MQIYGWLKSPKQQRHKCLEMTQLSTSHALWKFKPKQEFRWSGNQWLNQSKQSNLVRIRNLMGVGRRSFEEASIKPRIASNKFCIFNYCLLHCSDTMAPLQNTHPSTQALHADDRCNLVTDVAPPIHLSTIFRYPSDPELLVPSEDPVVSIFSINHSNRLRLTLVQDEFDGKNFVYSREFAPNATRFEAVLSSLLHAKQSATQPVSQRFTPP